MSYCPECGLDFDEELSTCPDCQVELVEIFPQAEERDPYRDFTPVFMCYSMDDAILVQSLLEQEDIPCLLSDLEQSTNGPMIGKDGQIRVLVPSDETEAAGLLIESALTDGGPTAVTGELII